MPVKKNISGQGSLIGRRVYLRPFSKNDLPYIQKWSNDPEIRRLTGEVTPMSRANAEKFYRQLRADKDRAWFVARYLVARRLTFLKNRNYVEIGTGGKWKLVRKTPLRNEVIRAKSIEWDLSPEDTVYRLLDTYIDRDKDKWEEYVKLSEEREKSLRVLKTKLEEVRRKLEETSPI